MSVRPVAECTSRLPNRVALRAGLAWPVLKVQPRHVRFRILNGAVSRAIQLSFQDAAGKVYNDRCRIVGSDGGVIGKDRKGPLGGRAYPQRGLYMGNAYRWDVVCDLRGLSGSLFLTNAPNEDLMNPVPPMFCKSHLLMRIDISATEQPSESLFPKHVDLGARAFNTAMPDYEDVPERGTTVDQEMGAAALRSATRRALNKNHDREMKFKKQSGYWVMNNNVGWDHNINKQVRATVADAEQKKRDSEHGTHMVASNIGQNVIEVWELQSGGGWVHPVRRFSACMPSALLTIACSD